MTTTVEDQISTINEKIDQKMGERTRSADERQYLTFQMGDEELGINILKIKEIISYSPVTRIPMVPDYIVGVMNVRGNVVPVVNLAPRFGRKPSEIDRLTCIIIIEVGSTEEDSMDIGIIVDSVEDVIEINNINIEAPPDFGAKIPAEYIAGIGKHSGKFIMLLNVETMLSPEELGDFETYQFSSFKTKTQTTEASSENGEKEVEDGDVKDGK